MTVSTRSPDRVSRRRRVRAWLLSLCWLVVVWIALWGSVSPVLVLIGLVVSVLAVLVFPLPIVEFHFVLRPWATVVLLVRFLGDIVAATAQIAWIAVRRRPPQGIVMTVPLTTRSDLVQTLTAIAVSLVPGSLIVDADPQNRTLTIHFLDLPDGDTDPVRARVLAQEQRILRAFGDSPGGARPDAGGNS